jgi:hypothetical protein
MFSFDTTKKVPLILLITFLTGTSGVGYYAFLGSGSASVASKSETMEIKNQKATPEKATPEKPKHDFKAMRAELMSQIEATGEMKSDSKVAYFSAYVDDNLKDYQKDFIAFFETYPDEELNKLGRLRKGTTDRQFRRAISQGFAELLADCYEKWFLEAGLPVSREIILNGREDSWHSSGLGALSIMNVNNWFLDSENLTNHLFVFGRFYPTLGAERADSLAKEAIRRGVAFSHSYLSNLIPDRSEGWVLGSNASERYWRKKADKWAEYRFKDLANSEHAEDIFQEVIDDRVEGERAKFLDQFTPYDITASNLRTVSFNHGHTQTSGRWLADISNAFNPSSAKMDFKEDIYYQLLAKNQAEAFMEAFLYAERYKPEMNIRDVKVMRSNHSGRFVLAVYNSRSKYSELEFNELDQVFQPDYRF